MQSSRVLILASLLALATAALAKTVVLDRIEASVNASIILYSDLRSYRKNLTLRSQLDPLFIGSALALKGAHAGDSEIVQFLVQEQLIIQEFPVTDNDVEQEINSIQANNHIDRKQLRAAVEAQGFLFKEYFDLIRIGVAKRNLIDRDIRTRVFIPDEDLKNVFYNQKDMQNTNNSYRIKIITFNPKNYKSPKLALSTAMDALKRIKEGEAFEEVAKQSSDDGSAQGGGDLGLLKYDEISTLFRAHLKELKLGQVSSVLGNEKSFYFVMKVADIQSSREAEFQRVKEQIRAQLSAKEYQRQIDLWLDRQRSVAFVHFAGQPFLPNHEKK